MTFNTQEESLSISFTKGIKTYLMVIITSHINATQKSIFSITGARPNTMCFKITKAITMIAAMVARMIITGINIPMISSLWLLNGHNCSIAFYMVSTMSSANLITNNSGSFQEFLNF